MLKGNDEILEYNLKVKFLFFGNKVEISKTNRIKKYKKLVE